MSPRLQTSPLRAIVPETFLDIINGSANLVSLGLHELPLTLDNFFALREHTKQAAPQLKTTERHALVLGLKALGYPVPEAQDNDTIQEFSRSVNNKMERLVKSLGKKTATVRSRIRYEENQLSKLTESINPDVRPSIDQGTRTDNSRRVLEARNNLEARAASAEAQRTAQISRANEEQAKATHAENSRLCEAIDKAETDRRASAQQLQQKTHELKIVEGLYEEQASLHQKQV